MTKTDINYERVTFDQNAGQWMAETKLPRYLYLKKHVLKILADLELKGKYVLELGCGVSPYLGKLTESQNYGLDISKELLRHNNPAAATFVLGNLLNCRRYFHCQFDLVFMVGVLHHLNPQDRPLAFNEVASLLNKNGTFFFVEPNMASVTGLYYLLRRVAQKMFPRDFLLRYLTVFSENEQYLFPLKIKKELRKAGFIVSKGYSIQPLRPPPVGFLKRINLEGANRLLEMIAGKKLNHFLGTTVIFICRKAEEGINEHHLRDKQDERES